MSREHKSKRSCEFMVMSSTGEKPDAELHIVAFEEKDGLEVQGTQRGGLRTQVALATTVVERLGKTILEEDGLMAAAAFVNLIGEALVDGCGSEAMKKATEMEELKARAITDPKEAIEVIEELLKMLKSDEDDEDDEEEDEDA